MKVQSLKLEQIPVYFFCQNVDPARRDQTFRRKPFVIAGKVYRSGVGLRCDGHSGWDLHGCVRKLTVVIGVDDESKADTAVFRIVDLSTDSLIGKERKIKYGEPPRKFTFDLTGREKIRIEWDCGKNTSGFVTQDLLEFEFSYTGKKPAAWFPCKTIETGNIVWTFPAEPEVGKSFKQHGILLRSKAGIPELELMDLYRTAPGRYADPGLYNLPWNIQLIHGTAESRASELLFQSMEQTRKASGVEETVITLYDKVASVTVEQHITAFFECDVFKCFTRIVNTGSEKVTLLARDAVNAAFPPCRDPYLTTFRGAQFYEYMAPEEKPLAHGTTLNCHSALSHNCQEIFPGCYISFDGEAKEESGTVLGAALGWDGNWQYKVNYAQSDRIFFSAGAQEEPVELSPGEEYVSPFVLLSLSDKGKGQVSRNFHDYFRYWGGLHNGTKTRHIVLNSWEGLVFEFDSQKLEELIRNAANLGMEMFVLDDGWFGNGEYGRDNSHGLGDWQVNTAKLPRGLEHCINECFKAGMKFGLWVEPEMVNTLSNLYNIHPEWVLSIPGRELRYGRGGTQLMLDLSRPEVENFVYESVANILKTYPQISYIKWDHNSRGTNQGSTFPGSEKRGLSDLHNRAFLRVMERLRKDFPEVIFQCCASGGGRADVGTMYYFDEFWCSDNSQGHHRIPIQYGSGHFFPVLAQASHVSKLSEFPSEYKFRCDVAMSSRMGVELDPAGIAPEDVEIIRKGVAAFKEIREIVHQGDLYRGRAPHKSDVTELTFVAKDGSRAVLFGFKRYSDREKALIKGAGLEKKRLYTVCEVNPDDTPRIVPGTYTGAELTRGIEVNFKKGSSSVVLLLK